MKSCNIPQEFFFLFVNLKNIFYSPNEKDPIKKYHISFAVVYTVLQLCDLVIIFNMSLMAFS